MTNAEARFNNSLRPRKPEGLLGTGKRVGGYGDGGEGDYIYTYRYTVTTIMTSAIFMFHNCEGQSHKTVSTDHNFGRERRAEADSNQGPSAYQPNALPLGQTGSRHMLTCAVYIT